MRAWSQDWSVPTTGAISQARERLGEAPVKMLSGKVAAPLAAPGAPGAWLGHRRVMAIDGVKLDTPDTAANLAWGPARPATGGRSARKARTSGNGDCGDPERVSKGRRKRTYPRVIKKYKGRTFPVKQPGQTGQRHDPILEIRRPLVALLN